MSDIEAVEPNCDECGVLSEDAPEWCGECGNCKPHCAGEEGCGPSIEQLESINDSLAALAASMGITLSDAALDDLTHTVAKTFWR